MGSKFKFLERIFLAILILVLIILLSIFLKSHDIGTSPRGIKIFVPWGLIAIFISFYLFREYNRVKKAKREERRRYLNEHRQELLNKALKKNKDPLNGE